MGRKRIVNNDSSVINRILEQYGERGFQTLSNFIEEEKQIIPVSPMLDLGLGGQGLLGGTVCVISGRPKLGKSTLAMSICKSAQKIGWETYIINGESRIKEQTSTCVKGLDLDKIHVLSSTKDKIMTAEDALSILRDLMIEKDSSLFIIDSITRLCAGKRLEDNICGETRNIKPRIFSDFFDQTNGIISVKGHILILISHIYANTSGYGKVYCISGGNSIHYQSDVRIVSNSFERWEQKRKVGGKDTVKYIGNAIKWNIESNSFGAPASEPIVSFIRFGHGIDFAKEILENCINLGFVEKNGHHFNIVGETEKFSTEEPFLAYLNSNEEKLNTLIDKVKSALMEPTKD